MIRFVLGAFIICVIAMPLSNVFSNLQLNLQDNIKLNLESSEELAIKANAKAMSLTENKVRAIAKQILNENDIEIKKVDVIMDTNENDSIDINKIVVYVDSQSNIDVNKIKDIIENELSIPTEIEKE